MCSTKYILLAGLIAVGLVACRGDRTVTLPTPNTIAGDYTGTYRLVQIEITGDTVFDSTWNIGLNFSDGRFTMVYDVSLPDSLQVFCGLQGEYVLDSDIEITVVDSNFTRGVCSPPWGFGGHFAVNWQFDTLRLTSDRTDSAGIRNLQLLQLVSVR